MIDKILIATLLFWSVSASAQLDSGYYLGLGVGQLDYGEDGFSGAINETTETYKLYGGFRFDDRWALEASYGTSGDLNWTDSAFVPGTGTFFADFREDWNIVEVRGIAHLKAFIAGVGYWKGDVAVDLTVTDPQNNTFFSSASDSESGYSIILGGEWEFDDWVIRAEYEHFDTESGVDLATAGVGVHFKF